MYKVSYPLDYSIHYSTLIYSTFIKRASKRNPLHCHDKVSSCNDKCMDINVLWLASPNNTEKFTGNQKLFDSHFWCVELTGPCQANVLNSITLFVSHIYFSQSCFILMQDESEIEDCYYPLDKLKSDLEETFKSKRYKDLLYSCISESSEMAKDPLLDNDC